MKEFLNQHGLVETVMFLAVMLNMALAFIKMAVEKLVEFTGKKIEDYKFMYYVSKGLEFLGKLIDLMSANLKHKK